MDTITGAMWHSVAAVTLQSFLFGYLFGCFNPCIVTGEKNNASACYHETDDASKPCPRGSLYNDLDLSVIETSLAVTLLIIGAWIGAIACSYPMETFGRRYTLIGNAIPFIVGGCLTGSGNLYCLFVGRFTSGIAMGFASVLGPLLLSEISTPENRGIITSMHQLTCVSGIFVSGVVGFLFVMYIDHGWQYAQFVSAGIGVLALCLSAYLPESPGWLIKNGRTEDAINLLKRLRPAKYNVGAELAELQVEQRIAHTANEATWSEAMGNTRELVAGCGLMAFYCFTGINTVSFYSTTIFGFAGFTDSLLATVILNLVNVLGTGFTAFFLVDALGRKSLLLYGLYLMVAALLGLSCVLYIDTSDDSSSSRGGGKISSSTQGLIAVICVMLYMAGFASGMGSVAWVLLPEMITKYEVRSKLMSVFLNMNWACNIVLGMTTLEIINGLGHVPQEIDDDLKSNVDEVLDRQKKGVAEMYFIFLGLTVVCIFFVKIFVYETAHDRFSARDGSSSELLKGIVVNDDN